MGIGLLVAGILVRRVSGLPVVGLSLILLGVGMKTYYIIRAIQCGLYTPGKELGFLFLGLGLFLGGLYLRGTDFSLNPIYLIITGLVLKVIFIVRFIQIVRSRRKELTDS